MRVLITGATGLVGQEIVKVCHSKNIKVNFLTTSKSKIVQQRFQNVGHQAIKKKLHPVELRPLPC